MSLRQFGVARIEVSLQERSRSLPFLVVVGAVSLVLAAEISLVGIASSFERPSMGRLISVLDSDDPQIQHRLGQVYAETDTNKSVQCLRRAAELSRYSRLYWSDLASACQSIDDTQCADWAAEHLLRLCPMVPYYHQLAAESYLRRNRLDESLAQFRHLLELDPIYATGAWADLLTVLEPDVIFQKVLANNNKIDSTVEVGYVDFAAPGAYQGARCLRVDFKVGRNDEYEPAYQIVAVQPNHTYSLEAYVRSQDISSTSGPCLRVTDTQQQGFEDAISETTVGTTDWHPVSLSFSTGPETQSVRLSLWRPRD